MGKAPTSAAVRLYDRVLQDHFARLRQMAFVSGPDADCFARKEPVVVPARTLLSQLL